jgi:hypothetical protein
MIEMDWGEPQDEAVWRGETDPPGSFVAEVRHYSASGGYMLMVTFDVYNLGDGKRLAERILALVNEPMQEIGDE